MFNNLIIQGHLTADPVYRQSQNGGKSSCWGKLGVYQGKDQQGNDLDSMFIEFTCFGAEADAMREAHKGDLVVASGRFSETKSTGNDGREYINKKVVGNARKCFKSMNQNNQQGQASPQAVQYQQNTQYQQPVQYQQQIQQYPQQNNQINPWG